MFARLEIVSRWIIFTIDVCLCIVALILAKVLKNNFIITNIDPLTLYKSIVISVVINALVFYNVKTFAGIVRYTSAQDSFRILFSVVLSCLILFFTNALFIISGSGAFVSNVSIIIYSLISFLFLITYRIIVKYFFMYLKNSKLDKLRVIIYGAGEAGVATKRTFDHDAKVNKTIIAFVDDDLRKVGKTIDGVKILDAAQLENLIIQHEVEEIIFASYTIPSDRKNQVVDVCLENDVKILNIPSPEVWARGQVTTAQIQNLNIEDLLTGRLSRLILMGFRDS
jgi:FlaA1/EpsC-like NDP-sugar epimerase